MEKIVIISRQPEPDHMLFASLSRLFPECTVHIIFRGVDDEYPALKDSYIISDSEGA